MRCIGFGTSDNLVIMERSNGGGGDVAKADKVKPEEADAFDIDNPELPAWIDEGAMKAGGYPYEKRLKRRKYEKSLEALQIELCKLQQHVQATGMRIVIVYEGRDSAGKGSCIKRFMEHINPRHARTVALAKPTERERGQWYFQRYAAHLPSDGEIVLFDRSWYNRAGVERVMGFCSEQQVADFLREAPQFESMIVREGILLFKFFLTIGRETQLKRFHERRHSPLKHWKLSSLDRAAIDKWDDYTHAREEMFRFTDTETCPWTVVRSNDQRRSRLATIQYVLDAVDYEGKDEKAIGKVDRNIAGSADALRHEQQDTA